ncbi:hypothetical protein [Streptomyces showdoensis]|uniref:Uncharacterized protein n=1 Tax=Streptomyces showdoensis TaxID=68268 RepID=A0A2P2GFN2_STREW|nr:hypothetical protein [Streptomyces showdoensis]KKZ70324.1 hypothetical protein VO63_29650 [Streptomyces showdoensis]
MRSKRTLPHALVRAATVFALSAGVALPAVITAPTAYAATVSRTTTLDDGRLTVDGLPNDALWIKVSVLASAAPDAAVLASTDELTLSAYAAWTTEAPIRLPEGTALGDYPLAVEYRLPGGTVQRWTGGSFGYRLHTGVSAASFDRTTTSYDSRDVVLSGKATTWNPATDTTGPAAEGTTVKVVLNLTDAYARPQSRTLAVATAADGTFTLPVTADDEITGGTAEVVPASTDTDPAAARPLPAVGVEKLKYRVTSDTDRFRVAAGTDVRVSGRVERLTTEGWRSFGGIPVVTVSGEPYPYTKVITPIGSGTTTADGDFSYPVRAQYSTHRLYTLPKPSVYFDRNATYPSATADIAVPQQFTYAGATMTLDEYGWVKARGRLGNGSTYCDTKPDWVALQVSLDNGRTFRTLKSGYVDTGCWYDFGAWGYVNAVYRIYHPESDRYVAKNTANVRLSRIETRIVNVTYSPLRPRVNGKMTVKGLVQQKVNGVWKAMPGARLTLYVKPKGDPNWYWAARNIATGSTGAFTVTTANYGDGTWGLGLQSKAGYFYSESRNFYVDAR